MQWLQDPNKSNVYNLNNVRREGSRHLRSKTKKYLKPKTDDFETNSKTKNIRDLYKASMNLRRVTSLWQRMSRVIWLQTLSVFWLGGGTISLSS